MPSQSVLEQKKVIVEELTARLKNSVTGLVVSYEGINTEDDTKLRKELRENNVHYSVVKNTLLKRAAEIAGVEGIEDVLEGTTALALSEDDIVTAPKILFKQEEASNGSFSIKKGFVDGKGISKDEVVAYAKLPTKETLLAQLVFMLQSPIQKLAIAVSEIEKKQSESAE